MSLLTAVFFFAALFSNLTAVKSCSPASEKTRPHCPPFGASFPSFPFSSSPGCGHPSFQISCSEPFSTISINDHSFTVVKYDPNSTTLTLSPNIVAGKSNDCPHSPPIPRRAVNLTGSPFHVADAFCSRLSSLRPCAGSLIPNCSRCPWECQLAKNPARILGRGCAEVRHRGSYPPCRDDMLEYLEGLLMIGIEIEWDKSGGEYFRECRECKAKNGVCGFDSSDPEKRFVCFRSQSRFAPPWIGIDDSKKFAVLITAFSLVCLLLASLIVIAIYRWRMFGLSGKSSSDDPTTTFLHRHRSASRLPPEFSYEELEISTNGFDPKRKIGDGGFGSVYLGRLADGKFVAVKYLHRHNRRQGRAFSSKSFCNEILILSSIHHQNLVRLHGFCSDPRGLVLVYDYVPNGTLADHLHAKTSSSPPLTWRIRIEIAVQTAAAIEYLHYSVAPPVVHRDITSANIFVEKDMRVKVGDFGLSRLLIPDPNLEPGSQSGSVWTGPQGTPGYLDPDYHRSFRLTEKSDVYSFGVVLMELITGMRAVDLSRGRTDISLADHVVSKIHAGMLRHVVDPALMDGSVAADGVEAVAELAFRCVAADRDDRPDAREVVRELVNIRSRTGGKVVIATDFSDGVV